MNSSEKNPEPLAFSESHNENNELEEEGDDLLDDGANLKDDDLEYGASDADSNDNDNKEPPFEELDDGNDEEYQRLVELRQLKLEQLKTLRDYQSYELAQNSKTWTESQKRAKKFQYLLQQTEAYVQNDGKTLATKGSLKGAGGDQLVGKYKFISFTFIFFIGIISYIFLLSGGVFCF